VQSYDATPAKATPTIVNADAGDVDFVLTP
jgi:hypothetical protein